MTSAASATPFRPFRQSLAPATAVVAMVLLGACNRDAAAPETAPATTEAPATAAPAIAPPDAPVVLTDITERDPRFIVGISFPPDATRYPGLATEIKRYADDARGELMQAVDALGEDKPPAPYDLSLAFTTAVETPTVVAVSADGSTYTGGAHGNPLVARFVWLPAQQKLLTIDELVPDKAGLQALSDYVRESLHSSLSQRIDADELDPADRAEILRSALKMIDEGSEPDAENFRQFEPVMAADGRIASLRFVFPPYQVGPYSDGVQTVEVPVAVLRAHLAPAFAGLFDGAAVPATPGAAATPRVTPAS